jgi:hypothetical protein
MVFLSIQRSFPFLSSSTPFLLQIFQPKAGIGWKIPKGEPAFGAASLQLV